MAFELGYNTNGFSDHRLLDVIDILAELGYGSIAITLDYHTLNPYDDNIWQQARVVRERLQARNLCCVIETGARFLLDKWKKHWPTLVTANHENRQRRVEFLKRAIEIAAYLNAEAVSFWSGTKDEALADDEAMTLLVEECDSLLTWAVRHDVWLAFEPEPGMLVATMKQYEQLRDALNHPRFGLTLDVGHVHCLADGTPAARIREFGRQLLNVHIEDMRVGVHEHLPFGDGDLDVPAVLHALQDVNYMGTVNVELARHSHDAVNLARWSLEYLKAVDSNRANASE